MTVSMSGVNILNCMFTDIFSHFAHHSFSVHLFPEGRRKSETPLGSHDPRTAVQLRTALKRLKEIMEGKSQVWMCGFRISNKEALLFGLYMLFSGNVIKQADFHATFARLKFDLKYN